MTATFAARSSQGVKEYLLGVELNLVSIWPDGEDLIDHETIHRMANEETAFKLVQAYTEWLELGKFRHTTGEPLEMIWSLLREPVILNNELVERIIALFERHENEGLNPLYLRPWLQRRCGRLIFAYRH